MTKNKKPISTGFPSADELLSGGLRSGELVCLAGPQTAANTRFICRAALAAAEQTKQTVLLVSLCASEKEIGATLRDECYGADEQLLQRILIINDNEITVEALEKRLMADDTVGTVLIDGGEWIEAFCEGSGWPPEYCLYCDLCCDENESMKSCNIYWLKKLAKKFNLPVAVTQTILDTEGKNRAELGISPETDRLLFLRCDDQTWQFWKSDENEAASPPDTDTEERKSPPDLLRFIPSKDVREHLKKIGWQPDAVQAASLVLKDETVPLYEQLETLRQITETLPDVLLDLPSFVENGETLHECLSAYVHDEEELLASFSDNENATFLVEGYKGKSTMMLRSVVGTTLDGCLKKVLDGVPDDQRSSLRIRVCKYYTNDRYAFTVIFNADRQPILRSGRLNWKAKEIEELKREPFTLPHPFQRLDLVWAPYWSSPEQGNDKRPFLLDRLPAPDAAFPNARRYASGWTVMPGGELDYFCSLPVEKLEFLPQNFPGKEEVIMKRLRRYLTGKEPLCTFVNAFAAFSLENVANNLERYDALVDFCETEEPASPVSPEDEAFFKKRSSIVTTICRSDGHSVIIGGTKMDFYQHVNSKDIREHLETIGYQFNALEAAWLVYQHRGITMDERHAAWREIIETMPDMRVEYADDTKESFESLHQLLRDYMAMEQRWYQDFITAEANAVYEYEYSELEIDFRVNSCLFAEFDACFTAMKTALSEHKNEEIAHIFINKRYIGETECDPLMIFDPYGAVMEVFGRHLQNETEHRIHGFFGDLWFAFPVPFQKGDIVYDPNGSEGGFCQGPFVLTETAVDVYHRTGTQMYSESDMTAYGYFQKEDGTLYAECMHHYMDLERYPEEKLTGKKRILKALSNQMKNEIDAVLFARAYHQILLEESARDSLPQDIKDEGMLLAGLKEEETE